MLRQMRRRIVGERFSGDATSRGSALDASSWAPRPQRRRRASTRKARLQTQPMKWGWTRVAEPEDLYCRRNGRTFRIVRAKDKRWKLYRIATLEDAGNLVPVANSI